MELKIGGGFAQGIFESFTQDELYDLDGNWSKCVKKNTESKSKMSTA